MRKKRILVLEFLILIPLLIFLSYSLIKWIDEKDSLSNLEKHTFTKEETIVKKWKYNHQNYVISRYYDQSSSWSHLYLLLKRNHTYYILENIKKCDTVDDGNNIYVKDNELYIHCIGKEDIDKYFINDLSIKKETIHFHFKNTPNISPLHMIIDKVDKEYIYLSSPFKVDNTIKENPNVKCSFMDKECSYIK